MHEVEPEPDHVLQVTKLTLLLFDQLIPDGSQLDRFILQTAAMLHDIGWKLCPTGTGHHKASEKMILAKRWKFIPGNTIRLIANIARYHRKNPPKSKHPRFSTLGPKDQHLVRKLAAILRIGDAMDRSHTQLIQGIECSIIGSKFNIEAVTAGSLEAEQYGIKKKSDLFRTVFGKSAALVRVGPLDQKRFGEKEIAGKSKFC